MHKIAVIVWFFAAITSVAAASTWLGHTMQTINQTMVNNTLIDKNSDS